MSTLWSASVFYIEKSNNTEQNRGESARWENVRTKNEHGLNRFLTKVSRAQKPSRIFRAEHVKLRTKTMERKWVLYTIQCPSLHLVSFSYRTDSPTYTIPFHLGQYGHCRIQMSINNIKIFLFNFWNFSENFSHLFA